MLNTLNVVVGVLRTLPKRLNSICIKSSRAAQQTSVCSLAYSNKNWRIGFTTLSMYAFHCPWLKSHLFANDIGAMMVIPKSIPTNVNPFIIPTQKGDLSSVEFYFSILAWACCWLNCWKIKRLHVISRISCCHIFKILEEIFTPKAL